MLEVSLSINSSFGSLDCIVKAGVDGAKWTCVLLESLVCKLLSILLATSIACVSVSSSRSPIKLLTVLAISQRNPLINSWILALSE